MSIFGLPLILFEVGVDVGDLEFIEGKVLAGDYFQVTGAINAITNTISFTVPNGKTAFMIEAKIVATGHTDPNGTDNAVQADFKIDGAVKDTANVGMMSSFLTAGTSGKSGAAYSLKADSFNVLGLSLIGNGVKVITIENTLDNGTANATFSGYLV